MVSPTTKDIIKIVTTYAYQNGMTLTDFAKKAEVSKSWISRLKNEDAEISLLIAQKLLNTAGYKIIIKHQSQISEDDNKPINTLTDEQIKELNHKKRNTSINSRLRKVIGHEQNSNRN